MIITWQHQQQWTADLRKFTFVAIFMISCFIFKKKKFFFYFRSKVISATWNAFKSLIICLQSRTFCELVHLLRALLNIHLIWIASYLGSFYIAFVPTLFKSFLNSKKKTYWNVHKMLQMITIKMPKESRKSFYTSLARDFACF